MRGRTIRNPETVALALASAWTSIAAAQFGYTNGSGFVESLVTISAQGFDSDYDFFNLAFPGPSGAWASCDAAVGGTQITANVLMTQEIASRIVSCRVVNKREATWGRVLFGVDSWAKSNLTLNFSMAAPNTNVLVVARGSAIHQGAGGLPGATGFVTGKLTLKRTLETPFINFNYNLSRPGSASNVYVSQAVLPTGNYQMTMNTLTNGEAMDGEVNLSVDLIAGCSTREVAYALPAQGVPIDVTLELAGNQLTKSVPVTGSLTGVVVFDCSNHPMALRLESIHLEPVENPVTWDLPLGMTLTATNISMDADAALGSLGPPAPIANNCCGTLVGVSPVVSGAAELVAADGASISMSFNDMFEPSFVGVPFTLTGFGDASTLALQLDYTGVIDLGLGADNPTVVSTGTVTGTGFSCPRADLDCDLVVGASDLAILLGNWSADATQPGCGGAVPCAADLNFDGVVGPADLAVLLGEWTT